MIEPGKSVKEKGKHVMETPPDRLDLFARSFISWEAFFISRVCLFDPWPGQNTVNGWTGLLINTTSNIKQITHKPGEIDRSSKRFTHI